MTALTERENEGNYNGPARAGSSSASRSVSAACSADVPYGTKCKLCGKVHTKISGGHGAQGDPATGFVDTAETPAAVHPQFVEDPHFKPDFKT